MKKINISLLLISVFIFINTQGIFAQGSVNSNLQALPKPIDISAMEFKNMINGGDVVVLDVRTAREFNAGHIKNAINIDWYQSSFENNANKLDKNITYLIYCRSGNRTSKTKYMLIGMGFKNIYNMHYGVNDWVKNKFELVQ